MRCPTNENTTLIPSLATERARAASPGGWDHFKQPLMGVSLHWVASVLELEYFVRRFNQPTKRAMLRHTTNQYQRSLERFRFDCCSVCVLAFCLLLLLVVLEYLVFGTVCVPCPAMNGPLLVLLPSLACRSAQSLFFCEPPEKNSLRGKKDIGEARRATDDRMTNYKSKSTRCFRPCQTVIS